MKSYLFRLRSAGAQAITILALFASLASAQVLNPKRIVYQVDARTIASNGGGTPATLTLTPTGSYVTLTCNDPDGCTITLGEAGIPDGMTVTIVNVSANNCTFTDSSAVSELAGAFTMGQYEAISLQYVMDRWVERSRSTSTKFTEWWPAATADDGGALIGPGWTATATASSFPAFTRYDGSNVHAATADFAEGETDNLYREFKLPADWVGALDLVLYWRSTATSGNVVWQIATSCSADAETDDASWNTAQTITDAAKGTTNQLNTASLTSLTTTGCAAGELFHLKFFRDPGHASDTLGATASLVGVELTYRRAM